MSPEKICNMQILVETYSLDTKSFRNIRKVFIIYTCCHPQIVPEICCERIL